MGETEVATGHRDGLDWIGFPTIEIAPSDIPQWAAVLVNAEPACAATAGAGDGYRVLEMPADCDIAMLPSPGDELAAHTRRSLILTRQVNPATSLQGETIQYRYFAPQYGSAEDTATGSAMRVLAAYWQRRGAGNALRALQRSAQGGWLLSRIDGDRTWVGGRVIEDGETA
jgi:hypothetical protein